jgi:hypothetical protein
MTAPDTSRWKTSLLYPTPDSPALETDLSALEEETGLKEGDEIDVKLIGMDPKTNKLKLSRKVLLPKPEGYVERERRPRGERPERGERHERHGRPERKEE